MVAENSMVWRWAVPMCLTMRWTWGRKPMSSMPVGLVEHENLDVGQVHRPLLQMVEQAARRGDDDVHAPAQAHDLRHMPAPP